MYLQWGTAWSTPTTTPLTAPFPTSPASCGAHLRRSARDAALQRKPTSGCRCARHRRRWRSAGSTGSSRTRPTTTPWCAAGQRLVPLLRRQALEDRGLVCGGQRRHRHAQTKLITEADIIEGGKYQRFMVWDGGNNRLTYWDAERGQVGRRDAQDPDHRLLHRASARRSRGSRLAARPVGVVRPGRRQVRRLLG